MHIADIGLVEQCANSDDAQVGHVNDGRAAAYRPRCRSDDGSLGDALVDHSACGGRLHRGVLQLLPGKIQIGVGIHDAGLRGFIIHGNLFVLLRRDDARLVHLLVSFLVTLRHGELGLRGVELRLGLVVPVLDVARVDLDDQVTGIHVRAGFDGHLGDDSGGFGLHLDDGDRLDHPVCRCVDDDVATSHSGGLDGGRLKLFRTGCRGDEQRRCKNSSHGGVSPEYRPGGKRVPVGLSAKCTPVPAELLRRSERSSVPAGTGIRAVQRSNPYDVSNANRGRGKVLLAPGFGR